MTEGQPVLHPNQFHVNEAWIAFKLNELPIRTERDGAFNCVGLMDAASCFILATTFVPASESEPSKVEARRLLKEGWAHKQQHPTTLFVPTGQFEANLTSEAEDEGVTVVPVDENQLLVFIGEARRGFTERFGSGAPANDA